MSSASLDSASHTPLPCAASRQTGTPLHEVPEQLTGSRTPTATAAFRTRLDELGFDSYLAYISSGHWRGLHEAWRADTSRPQHCICGSDDWHLHHRTYARLGAEHLDDLFPLCSTCHGMLHVYVHRGLISLDTDPEIFRDRDRAEQYAADLADMRDRAVREMASPKRLNLLDRESRKKLLQRASEFRRYRRWRELQARVKTSTPRVTSPHLATPEDLQVRVFEP